MPCRYLTKILFCSNSATFQLHVCNNIFFYAKEKKCFFFLFNFIFALFFSSTPRKEPFGQATLRRRRETKTVKILRSTSPRKRRKNNSYFLVWIWIFKIIHCQSLSERGRVKIGKKIVEWETTKRHRHSKPKNQQHLTFIDRHKCESNKLRTNKEVNCNWKLTKKKPREINSIKMVVYDNWVMQLRFVSKVSVLFTRACDLCY